MATWRRMLQSWYKKMKVAIRDVILATELQDNALWRRAKAGLFLLFNSRAGEPVAVGPLASYGLISCGTWPTFKSPAWANDLDSPLINSTLLSSIQLRPQIQVWLRKVLFRRFGWDVMLLVVLNTSVPHSSSYIKRSSDHIKKEHSKYPRLFG